MRADTPAVQKHTANLVLHCRVSDLDRFRSKKHLFGSPKSFYKLLRLMTHELLVEKAVEWLRRYRCGIVLSEQACCTGEVPDAIGWKKQCHSVLIECKVSRADFLADRQKPWRQKPELGVGTERFYLAPPKVIGPEELPSGWGLLEFSRRKVTTVVKPSRKSLRSQEGFLTEMNLLLASLRRVEVRIEPQTITDFLKWKNRLAEYNGGQYPQELLAPEREDNVHLQDARPVLLE